MRVKLQTIIAAILIISVMIVSGLLSDSYKVPGHGRIKTVNIDAYSNPGCTIPLTDVNLTTPLSPGSSTPYTVYLKNNGNVPMTLSMTYGNWIPINTGSYISITWDREGKNVGVGTSIDATLNVIVSLDIVGKNITDFSVEITFTGTE